MNGKRNSASKHTQPVLWQTFWQCCDKRELCLASMQHSHWGMWLSSSVQAQLYLVGNIHHQVITFVSIAVLKQESGRLILQRPNSLMWTIQTKKPINTNTYISTHVVFVIHFAFLWVQTIIWRAAVFFTCCSQAVWWRYRVILPTTTCRQTKYQSPAPIWLGVSSENHNHTCTCSICVQHLLYKETSVNSSSLTWYRVLTCVTLPNKMSVTVGCKM